MRWTSEGDRTFVALPVFPVRMFRHGTIWVHRDAGIDAPRDLEGKRVGLSQFPQTAAIWIRGILAHDYGVDLASIAWLHEPQFPAPPAVRELFQVAANTSGKPLDVLLTEGEIDAYLGARIAEETHRHPRVRRLFPDYVERERDYYRRTGIFPIMHAIALRREVHEAYPFAAAGLCDALARAKDVAREKMRYMGTSRYMLPWLRAELEELDTLFDGDPYVDGLDPNRTTLETLLTYLEEQALVERPITLEDVFYGAKS
jgi:4,5-dihydroxyphthalate decarboxylase